MKPQLPLLQILLDRCFDLDRSLEALLTGSYIS